MTAQIPEVLFYKGEKHTMCAEPLWRYFDLVGEKRRFAAPSSALWRGYVGTWEIRDDRLYMIGLRAKRADGSDASLETVFPGFPERVFAHWFSGRLRLPHGALLEYVHAGYGSRYEVDLFLEVHKGVVTKSWTQRNGSAEAGESEGYQIHALTTFPQTRGQEPAE